MFFNQEKSVQARLVGNTLVAAFHTSNPSLIWKYDLERNHSFTLTLQGEDGDFELGVSSPKGEFYPVARFAAREDAEEAIAAVQKVLMKRSAGSWWRLALDGFGGLAILILLVMFFGTVFITREIGSSVRAAKGTAEIKNGVPMSADQVLRPPS